MTWLQQLCWPFRHCFRNLSFTSDKVIVFRPASHMESREGRRSLPVGTITRSDPPLANAVSRRGDPSKSIRTVSTLQRV